MHSLEQLENASLEQEKLNFALVDAVLKRDIVDVQQQLSKGADPWFNDAWAIESAVQLGYLPGAKLLKQSMEEQAQYFGKEMPIIKGIWVVQAIERKAIDLVEWILPYCNVHEAAEVMLRASTQVAIHSKDSRFFDLLAPLSNLPRAFSYLLGDPIIMRENNQFERYKDELLLLWNTMKEEDQKKVFQDVQDKPLLTPYFEQIVLAGLPVVQGKREVPRL